MPDILCLSSSILDTRLSYSGDYTGVGASGCRFRVRVYSSSDLTSAVIRVGKAGVYRVGCCDTVVGAFSPTCSGLGEGGAVEYFVRLVRDFCGRRGRVSD